MEGTLVAFGFVVDDEAPDKLAAGGAGEFAAAIAERATADEEHAARCPSCQVLGGEQYGCVGLIPTPLSADVERWLVDRLPADIDGLPGFLLRKAIGDYGYDGESARRLRAAGLLAAPMPFTRHFGPFFRRFTVSSEQLLEEMLCAGDVDPAHALAVLVHLGGILVDGRVPAALDDGAALSEVVQPGADRRGRTALAPDLSAPAAGDDEGLAATRRFLRALYAGFVVDAPIKVFAPSIAQGE